LAEKIGSSATLQRESVPAPSFITLWGTAKENRLNPYDYLIHLFKKLPNLDSRDNKSLDQLLPWNVSLQ
jgi:hypothetical protein